MCSKRNGTLYIGVTNDISRRVYEHKNNLASGFTQKYAIKKLVYVEEHGFIYDAIRREKCIKKWNRIWKLSLIEKHNPDWKNLYGDGDENEESGSPPPRG